jgi:hypothetical protein
MWVGRASVVISGSTKATSPKECGGFTCASSRPTELACGGPETVVLYAEPHDETTRGFLPVDRVRYALDEDLAASVDGGD